MGWEHTAGVVAWHIDERAFAGPEHLDPAYVAGYERKSGYDPTPDVDALVAHGVGPSSTVLDMGAGTGAFTAAMAPRCRRVVAVDVSPAMVAAVWDRAAADGLGNVTVVHAGLVSYEHEGPPVDAVFCRNVLHQVPDFWKGVALDRLFRALRPGGVLRLLDLVYDVEPADVPAFVDAWFAGAVDDPAQGYTADDLATHVRTESSTYSWLFEPLIERVGFTIVEREYRRSAYASYTCLRPLGESTSR